MVNRYKEGFETLRIKEGLGEVGIQAYNDFTPKYQFHLCEIQVHVYKLAHTCLATLIFLVQFMKNA